MDWATLARPEIFRIQPYSPGKPIAEVERELGLRDVIKLASNENPLGPSPRAVAALAQAISSVHFYPESRPPLLRRRLAELNGVSPDQVIVGNGSDELIKLLAETFLRPGDEVLLPAPTFSEYEFAAHLMGARPVSVPCRDFKPDWERMVQAVTERTRMIFLPSPNNPTGRALREEELISLLSGVPPAVLVVVDEAYREYAEDPLYHRDSPRLLTRFANLVLLRTFSKIYGLAGLRIGYGLADPAVIDLVYRVCEPFNVNALAQEAALAALDDEEHLAASRENNRRGKEYLEAELKALGLNPVPTEANFFFVGLGRDCREVFRALLQRGIIVRTGDIFGEPEYIRVTIGTPEQNRRLIQALAEVVGGGRR
ncbi:MAG: histidinol-phosphate transaminase [Bacillota bacterium]|nr:histidinol-phosphate transaminase [Bacillota bacterium]